MVGQTITSRFARSSPPSGQAMARKASSESKHAPRKGSVSAVTDDGQAVTERSVDSQQTVQQHSRSGSASTGSVIDLLQQAEEMLSSTGHTIGHGSTHDLDFSGSSAMVGHDPRDADSVIGGCVGPESPPALDGDHLCIAGARSPMTRWTTSRAMSHLLASKILLTPGPGPRSGPAFIMTDRAWLRPPRPRRSLAPMSCIPARRITRLPSSFRSSRILYRSRLRQHPLSTQYTSLVLFVLFRFCAERAADCLLPQPAFLF